jgi:hypothetical protein
MSFTPFIRRRSVWRYWSRDLTLEISGSFPSSFLVALHVWSKYKFWYSQDSHCITSTTTMFDNTSTQSQMSPTCTALISILPSYLVYIISIFVAAAYFITPYLPSARMKCLENVLHDADEMLRDTLEEGLLDPQFVRKTELSLKRCAPVHRVQQRRFFG